MCQAIEWVFFIQIKVVPEETKVRDVHYPREVKFTDGPLCEEHHAAQCGQRKEVQDSALPLTCYVLGEETGNAHGKGEFVRF